MGFRMQEKSLVRPGHAVIRNACGGPPGPGADNEMNLTDRLNWQAGTPVKVAWGVTINHGGGYAYRLSGERAAVGSVLPTAPPGVCERHIDRALGKRHGGHHPSEDH